MKFQPLLVGALALALGACGDADEPAGSDTVAEQTAIPTATSTAMAAQAFVDTVAASDMYEVEAGKLAQEKGASQAVKDFGAMMVKDHTQSTADLKAGAAETPGLTVAPKLTAGQEADLAALRDAGDTFDTLYTQQQSAAHSQALALLQDYGANGDSASLKAFATKTASVVDGHLAKAGELP